VEYRLHPRRPSDNTSAILDSAKLLRHFPGFRFRELEAGISETIAWAMSAQHSCADRQRRNKAVRQG